MATGIENAHCHHLALHSPYEAPYGLEPGGKTVGLEFAATASVAGPARPSVLHTMAIEIDWNRDRCLDISMVSSSSSSRERIAPKSTCSDHAGTHYGPAPPVSS